MAINHTLNSPGRSRLTIDGVKIGGFALRFTHRRSSRVPAVLLRTALKLADHPGSETTLKAVLPYAFCIEAEAHGYTLTECMEEAKALLDAMGGEPGPLLTDLQLALLIANTAADLDPYLILVRLRDLLKVRGKYALRILRDCEYQYGRDGVGGKGYLRVPSSMDQICPH